jgi:WD40 repeat protein
VSASADGRVVAIVDDASKSHATVFLRDDPSRQVHLHGLHGAYYVSVSRDGRWVAGGTRQYSGAVIWDARSGDIVARLPVSGGAMVRFSADGGLLFTGESDRYRAWDAATWRERWAIARENPGIGTSSGRLDVSPRGDMLAVLFSTGDVRLIEAETGDEITRLPAPDFQTVGELRFSPSGSLLALAHTGNTIRIWDLARLRARLAAMRLEGNLPPLAPAAPAPRPPLRLEVRLGDLAR